MTSLYKQSIPVFVKYLKTFDALLDKATKHAADKSVEVQTLVDHRLIEDQRALPFQVISCCNTAVWFADRAGRLEHTEVADDQTTIPQLKERLAGTVKYLESVDAAKIDAHVDEPIRMETKVGVFVFDSAQRYLSEFAIPNFHFHLSTGYCILRAQGVDIGAFDYLRDVFVKEE